MEIKCGLCWSSGPEDLQLKKLLGAWDTNVYAGDPNKFNPNRGGKLFKKLGFASGFFLGLKNFLTKFKFFAFL